MSNESAREELARIAAELRVYLEWQADAGATVTAISPTLSP